MAGGIWTSQNKTLPGVYINVKSQGNITANVGTRGIVAICEPLSWGAANQVRRYIPGEDSVPYIGYPLTSEKALFLREIMKGSDVTAGPTEVLLYRPAGTDGVKATATIGALTVTALYEGVRGNDITITIAEEVDNEGTYDIATVVDGTVQDAQAVTDLSQLVANDWVTFTGTGTTITQSAGQAFTTGKDPTIAAADYATFMTAIEPYRFDILIYDGSDSTTIQAIASFVKRVSDNIGQKCQAVMAGETAANSNSEFVIAVKNGVKLDDGTALTAQQATWWVGGAEAGALYDQSLTYAQYPNAVEANPKLTDTQAAEAVKQGYLCFIDTFNTVKVCTDINSHTTFTADKGQEFSKNRVMRVLMQFCNDVYEYFSNSFIGKVDNNETGRNLLKGWIVGYLNDMQANNGIQNFDAEDVTVSAGNSIDSVLINVLIQPVDSIEKIYLAVTVSVNTGAAE